MTLPPPDMTLPSIHQAGAHYYSASTVERLLAAERERLTTQPPCFSILTVPYGQRASREPLFITDPTLPPPAE